MFYWHVQYVYQSIPIKEKSLWSGSVFLLCPENTLMLLGITPKYIEVCVDCSVLLVSPRVPMDIDAWKKNKKKIPDDQVDFCKYLSINWIAAGSNSVMDFYNFSNRLYITDV